MSDSNSNLPEELRRWAEYCDEDHDIADEIEESVRNNGGPSIGGYLAEADAYMMLSTDWIEPVLMQFRYGIEKDPASVELLRVLLPVAIAQAKYGVLRARRMLCSLELAHKKLEELLAEQQKTKD